MLLNQIMCAKYYNIFLYHLPCMYQNTRATFLLIGNAKSQHCRFPDILVEQIPLGPSQVDVTELWAISVQSHINVVFLNLQLDSLINNGTERGVSFPYLSQWAVNFET